jgi:integrase/recombinase XerC/integrase/recombinase XerD
MPPLAGWLPTFSSLCLLPDVDTLLRSRSSLHNAELQRGRRSLEYYLEPLSGLDLPGKEELRGHLQEKYRSNCKPNTLRGTVASGKLFLGFFKGVGKDRLEQLTRQDLEAFVEHEQDRGMAPRTVRTRLSVVRAFARFLEREEIVGPQVLSRSLRIKLPENLPKAIAPEDVRRLLDVLTDMRDRALILVLLRTGMRIGELLDTKVEDVHLAERRIEIPQAQKNAVGRVVYLSDDAGDALNAWLRTREPHKVLLFYAQGRDTMGYATARVMFRKYLAKAGLQDKGYTLHRLRHTFASDMLNAGMRLECLQQLLGHSTIEMTRRYARLTDITREEEYFHAMEIIEKGEIHGHYQLDPELQAVLEEKKLLRPYRKALSGRSEAIPPVGGPSDRAGR